MRVTNNPCPCDVISEAGRLIRVNRIDVRLQVGYIERRAGMKFERIGAPQPSEMARIAAERAVDAIEQVCDHT